METKETKKSSNSVTLRVQEFAGSFTEEDFKKNNAGMLILAAGNEPDDNIGIAIATMGSNRCIIEALYQWLTKAPDALETLAVVIAQISKKSKSKVKKQKK